MTQTFKKRTFVALASLLVLSVAFSSHAQTTAQSVASPSSNIQTLISESGYSLDDLQTLGIDLSDPEAAIDRARSLGIPESQIRKYLKAYQQQMSAGGAGITAPQITIPTMLDTMGTVITMPGDVQYGQSLQPQTSLETKAAPKEIRDTTDVHDPLLIPFGRFKTMQYFGYSIFRAGKGDFAAMKTGPADPGYVIGAGDIIRLYVWGEVQFQYELPVDNNGNIYIPNVGQFFASGASLEGLRSQLRTFLSRQYSGLKTSPPTSFIDVNLAFVKGTEVYLMGDALQPGNYSLSGFATAFNLMYTSKGPKTSGSLRELRIIREGKIVAKVDLYDYLARGRPTTDQRLRNGDILFVPPRGNTVAILGEVRRPAVYETLSGENLKDLIEIAGGVNAIAYPFRMQIDRIIPIEKRQPNMPDREVLDFNLVDVLNGKKKVPLEDGDLVTVFRLTDEMMNYVHVVGGGITHPGRYQLTNIKTVKDLVEAAEGLTDDAYPYKADLVRTRKDLTRMMLVLDLSEALIGNPIYNLTLEPRDSLHVFGRQEWEVQPKVNLRGFVREPGEYHLPDSLTVYDLIFEHSGLQDSLRWEQTFLDRGDIFRLMDDGLTRTRITFSVLDLWNHQPGSNITLQDNDIVVLYEKTITKMFKREVSLSGAIRNPGDYELADNMTLADLIVLGGGFTEDAWVLQAEISRVDLTGMPDGTLAQIINVPMVTWRSGDENPESYISDLARNKTPASEFQLQPYDQVRIRKNPGYKLPGNVEIRGEVMFPGNYTLHHENETLRDLIDRAGGLRPTAHAAGGKLVRGNQRLFLDFNELLLKKNTQEDVVLHPNDLIIIPERPNAVTVIGEVINPGIYKFIEGKRAKDYLREAGGKTRNGDKLYVTQPSGRTLEIAWLHNPKVEDGGVLRVVPKKVESKEPIDYSGIIKDTMAIASAALTIIVLATRL
ncbi:MAG: SLBB domain-containing protein [bacterium]